MARVYFGRGFENFNWLQVPVPPTGFMGFADCLNIVGPWLELVAVARRLEDGRRYRPGVAERAPRNLHPQVTLRHEKVGDLAHLSILVE